jgi:hypothetical protein
MRAHIAVTCRVVTLANDRPAPRRGAPLFVSAISIQAGA